jgi:ABC-type branched-subunit amino acid transport system ATPase component
MTTVATRAPAAPVAHPAVEVRSLDFSYGQVQVLFGVDLHVSPGEVLALLGTNGAGKSTLLANISGLRQPDRGQVLLAGADITHTGAEARVVCGVVQVPGGRAVFPTLSVADNLKAGCHSIHRDRGLVRERIDDVLGLFPVLGSRLSQRAGTLSGGEQQMLGLAKGLLLAPSVLLIDELSLGLAPVVVQQLLAVVESLRAKQVTMILVEQSINVALSLADRAVFMEKGHVRFEGDAAGLLERDDLVRAVFLGGARG